MLLAPIVLFVYNRPRHTQQTVEALRKNDLATESDLFIFADGPKVNATEEQKEKIRQVREYIHKINGFKSVTIFEKETNCGLANSVVYGVTKVIDQKGKVIVLEDDIITHRFFLRFMNEALNFYEHDDRIYNIGAYIENIGIPKDYNKDIFASYRCETWGWATWKDCWAKYNHEFDHFEILKTRKVKDVSKFNRGGDDLFLMLEALERGQIDSWALRWQHCMFLNNALCVRPVINLVANIGCDGTGIHSGDRGQEGFKEMSSPMYNKNYYDFRMVKNIEIDTEINDHLIRYFSHPNVFSRKKKLYSMLFNHGCYPLQLSRTDANILQLLKKRIKAWLACNL